MKKNKGIADSIIAEWLVHKELQRLQERKLADTWNKEIEQNKNTDLWLSLKKKLKQ